MGERDLFLVMEYQGRFTRAIIHALAIAVEHIGNEGLDRSGFDKVMEVIGEHGIDANDIYKAFGK